MIEAFTHLIHKHYVLTDLESGQLRARLPAGSWAQRCLAHNHVHAWCCGVRCGDRRATQRSLAYALEAVLMRTMISHYVH